MRRHLLDRDDKGMLQAALMQDLSSYKNLEVSNLWCDNGVQPRSPVEESQPAHESAAHALQGPAAVAGTTLTQQAMRPPYTALSTLG